jgi:hypothetical protein
MPFNPVKIMLLDLSKIPDDAPIELAANLLGTQTQARLSNLRPDSHRTARVVFAAVWQGLVAQHGALPPGRDPPLGANGKPILSEGPAFSVAHTKRLGALAIGGSEAIGLDIVDRHAPAPRLPDACRMALAGTDKYNHGEDVCNARLWARLEALTKRDGLSLAAVLDGRAQPVSALARRGILIDLDIGDRHAGALASSGRVDTRIQRLEWADARDIILQRAANRRHGNG